MASVAWEAFRYEHFATRVTLPEQTTAKRAAYNTLTKNYFLFHFTAPLPSYSIIVASPKAIWQLFMDTKHNRFTTQKLQIQNPSMLVALDYNPVDKRIYWSDVDDRKIKRMSVTGIGGEETIAW